MKASRVATALENNLDELRRRQELESLRVFVENEQCFMPSADPKTANITMEELKKLARVWKLHERRNFWKMHTERNSMVSVLLQHIEDTNKYVKPKADGSQGQQHFSPLPPSDSRPSHLRGAAGSNGSGLSSSGGRHVMRNICGLSYFNREVAPSELAIHSRFFSFPESELTIDTSSLEQQNPLLVQADKHAAAAAAAAAAVPATKNDDDDDEVGAGVGESKEGEATATAGGEEGGEGGGVASSSAASELADDPSAWSEERKLKEKANKRMLKLLNKGSSLKTASMRKAKHRNLAQHLFNFSASGECNKSTLSLSAIQTFMAVSESEDPATASYSMIAISNISSMPHVRTLLVELNVVHKFSNILAHITGTPTIWATGLLFYYFSCDLEIEDRIYNLSSAMLKENGMSDHDELQILAMYTLSNLLPCIDRQRVTEIFMAIIKQYVPEGSVADGDKEKFNRPMALIFLPILLGICSFTNTHMTLMTNDCFEVLAQAAVFASERKDIEVGLLVANILLSFLNSQDSPVAHHIATDSNFVFIFEKLLEMYDLRVLSLTVRALSVMSGSASLVDCVCDGTIVSVVANMIDASGEELPSDIAVDVAKYYSNICQPTSKEYLRRLVDEDKVPEAILQLIRKSKGHRSVEVHHIVIKGLQNILSHQQNSIDLADSCLVPIMGMLRENNDLGAAEALYNISCARDCLDILAENKTHVKLLDYFTSAKDIKVKTTYLSVMCNMSSRTDCIDDLLSERVIDKFDAEIKAGLESAEVWPNAVKIILAIVNYREDLTEVERATIVGILKVICQKGTPLDIVGKASVVLAYLSLSLEDFSEVDGVLRAILALSNNELVVESASTVLYNVTCSAKNASILVKDSLYINIMIRLMRNGKPEVQLNIAQAMRTLCSLSRCTDLLLKDNSLSDLIVIALLRTSSEEIKVVCSEAFYNMLCHDGVRKRLLNGDLWWAITRICRNDSERIKHAGARALFDLSCDLVHIEPLRERHVLAFIQDITSTGSVNFLDTCLRALNNIVCQFQGPLIPYELIPSIRIGVDAFNRCKSIDSLLTSMLLLLKCAVQWRDGADAEFIQQEISVVFNNSRAVWGVDADCRKTVSQILWEVTQSAPLARATPILELGPSFATCYVSFPTDEICENLCSTFIHYVLLEKVSPLVLLELPVVRFVIYDAFGVARIPASEEEREACTSSSSAPYSLNCRAYAIALLAYLIDTLRETSPMLISGELIQNILSIEHLNNKDIKDNLMVVVHSLTKDERLATFLFEAGLFNVLSQYMSAMKVRTENFNEYCSSCLRNLALHKGLIRALISLKGSQLDTLVEMLIDGTDSVAVCMDIGILLFCSTLHGLSNEFTINSKFILDCVPKLSELTKDVELSRIFKWTVGEILEKYSMGVEVNPAFVQCMYTEMISGTSESVAKEMESTELKNLALSALFTASVFSSKQTPPVEFEAIEASADIWSPYMVCERKKMQTELLASTRPGTASIPPLLFESLTSSEVFPVQQWFKIVKTYDRVSEVDPATLTKDGELGVTNAWDEDGEEDPLELSGESGIGGLSPNQTRLSPTTLNLRDEAEMEEHGRTEEDIDEVVAAAVHQGGHKSNQEGDEDEAVLEEKES